MLVTILTWLVFGFVVGLIARAIFPGTQSIGFLGTVVLGVIGSFVGGFVANALTGHPLAEMRSAGFIGSIIGALIVLAIASFVGRRRRTLV